MIMVWNTNLASGNSITLPLRGTVNCTVNWGDGTSNNYTGSGNRTKTYATGGTYTVTITGTVTQYGAGNTLIANRQKLTQVTSFGNIGLTSLRGAFIGCTNLTVLPAVLPPAVTILESCLWSTTATTFTNLELWDVSNVRNLGAMFFNNLNFNQDISGWDTSSVETLNSTFGSNTGPTSFNQPIGSWDVRSLRDLNQAFVNAAAFNQDLSAWDTASLTDLRRVFMLATSFNQDVSSWDTSKVTTMAEAFRGATSFNQPLNDWDTSEVRTMLGMFRDATSFNQPLNNWRTSNVTNMTQMFENAAQFNQNLSLWCVPSITSEPANFSTGSPLSFQNKPVWGTCPSTAEVVTGSATQITKTSAKLSGAVTDDGGLTTARGIAVATQPEFEAISLVLFAPGFGVGSFDATFTGLTAGQTYYFRAFGINAAGRSDGDWVEFTTEPGGPPTVFTGFASRIKTFSARLSGSVTSRGEGRVTSRGIVLGPRTDPVIGQQDVINISAGSGLGDFTVTADDLDADTLYYFRAYAGNIPAGTAYGDTEDFTTDEAGPPIGLSLNMPTVDEDNASTGTARFQIDPLNTGNYTWEVSAQTSAPYTPGSSAALTVQGLPAGTVAIVSNGRQSTIRFTPVADWFGTATFSYRVSNGFAESDWEQASVTIRPVPDPPSAVVGEFPNFDEDDTAEFSLTWTDVDDIPPGSLSAQDGYFIQMRPTAGGAWRWLTEGSPTARLTNVVIRVLNYSNTQLAGTFRVEPDANYYGPYGAQVRVAQQVPEGQGSGFVFGPTRNLSGVIASVPDAPTRPQPSRMPTAKIGQTVAGTFTTFDPDIEDTSWTFEISEPDADTWGSSIAVLGVGELSVVDDNLADQKAQVQLDQTDKFTGALEYARWSFAGNSFAPVTSLGGTATNVVNGSLSALTIGDLGYLSAPVLIANPASGATSAAAAVSTGSYFEFTATLPAGINWTALTFKAARGGATVPRGYAVRTSADSFAATLKTEDIPTQRTVFTDFEVPLTGLPTGVPVTFRMYVYSPGTGASVEFDDIRLLGSVASELLRYEFDLRVTDSSGLISPVQRVTGLITLPTATVFLQKVTRNSPATVTPLTPLVEVFELNVVDSIDGIGGADVTVSTDEVRRRAAQLGITAAELLEPGTVELVIAVGTQLVFAGPVSEIEWSATRDRINVTARGLLAYLEERRIGTGTTSFVGEDISDIMWTLIDDAQSQTSGDYAFTDDSTPAGTNLTVEFETRARILEALRNLSRADGGPDFWVEPDRTFNTAQARGQDRRDLIRLTPGMMTGATWTNRDEQLATVVTVIGGDDGSGGFFEGTAVTLDTVALSKYGRRELLIERSELTSNQACLDYAARVVAEQARRSETIRADIIVTPDRPFSIRDLEVGDIVTVDLRAPDLGQVIGAYRVVNRRLNLVSETADSYRVRLDLIPAPFISDTLVKVKARHNASIVERLAQLGEQQ